MTLSKDELTVMKLKELRCLLADITEASPPLFSSLATIAAFDDVEYALDIVEGLLALHTET